MLMGELASLRQKYLELAALRLEREAAEARGVLELSGAAAHRRRRRARALARRFPGALRQLEGFNAQAFYGRARDIQAEMSTLQRRLGSSVPPHTAPRSLLRCLRRAWVRVVLDFHALVLARQRRRRWLRARGLAGYARSSNGLGLMQQVWAELARRHKLTSAEVRCLVMGQGGRGTQ